VRMNKPKPSKSKRLATSSIVRAIRMKTPTRSKKPARAKGTWHFARPTVSTTSAAVVAGVCVSAVALMMVLWPSSRPGDDVGARSAGTELTTARASARPQSKAAPYTASPAVHRPAVDAIDAAIDPTSGNRETTAVARDASPSAPITITGCLEQDDETFRLKDTEGNDAPKARSWKSGFLKKRSAPVALVDAGHRLPRYIGQRIAATGTLENREMQVHSVQRVAASCS
jgi:hypothetical protein